ncbi:MAG: MGMT family protein [Bacteroidales bacterium]|nr:MGMT family protein [Bacteroidales bacterium]MCU0407891.1 MGMT family protein [Bacteroidales bacterium]
MKKTKQYRTRTAGKIPGDDFFSRVYDLVRLIPPGRVTSYGAIAAYLGSGRSARMVGWALNASHSQPGFIPAHRVVNRKGMLTGKHHFGNSTTMQQLLQNEGLIVEDDLVINFRERFWDPMKELDNF